METMTLWNGTSVPRIGVGCWAIGGVDYGEVYDHESLAGLRLAYEMGARVFDTAIAYGWGRSERVVGQAFGNSDDVVIVTKFGHPADHLSAGTIRASIELSRANLKRDRIDVALFHVNEFPPGEAGFVFDTLAELREKGWIAAFGWSTDAVESVKAFAGRDGFVAIENNLNVFEHAAELMAHVEQQNLLAISRLPLAMGMLSGKYSAGESVGANDIRARKVEWMRYFKDGKAAPEFVRRLEAIRELLQTGGRTLAQGALCWILARSPNALPVPGFKTEAQIRDNLGALEKGPLPEPVMAEIAQLLTEREAA
jgi:aryl-alcohol dehydrogenase-like predicted oxidoreductase